MSFKTVQGILSPDGKLTLSNESLPDHPVPVMVTLLEHDDESLSDLGDYQPQLADYEDRLARGEIQWQ